MEWSPGSDDGRPERDNMKIEKGMRFRGNVNGVCFEVLEANEKIVKYAVILKGSRVSDKVHIFGRKAFEHCDISLI